MKSGSIQAGPEAFRSCIKVEEVGASTFFGQWPLFSQHDGVAKTLIDVATVSLIYLMKK
jgi:hypothetical protein